MFQSVTFMLVKKPPRAVHECAFHESKWLINRHLSYILHIVEYKSKASVSPKMTQNLTAINFYTLKIIHLPLPSLVVLVLWRKQSRIYGLICQTRLLWTFSGILAHSSGAKASSSAIRLGWCPATTPEIPPEAFSTRFESGSRWPR